MKLLVVYCHPCSESFGASIRDTALRALDKAGHEVRLIDLYAQGFNPVMSAEERRGYHEPGSNEAPVAEHLAQLRWCEGLIFIHPTWWYGPPAMLKGWLERVWVPHATFTMPENGKAIGPVLTQIRLLGVISTLGSPWWWWTLFMKAPGRNILLRGLKSLCAPRCRTMWLALHRLDETTEKQRRYFLAKVEKRLASLKN
ncbi:NAD(P)H-dependent oxidoreductase [Labrys sp. 22185]|uniref:NAD(P)H-dependent oxidoreductase n=1 Tax=Labrys sp. 22185 TaxID=3453888 RepID=UPI003F876FDF